MARLTTGIRSEKCVVRRFRRCANIIHCIGYIYYRQHNKQLAVMVFTTTCFDSHESSSGYVQNLLVIALLLLTVLEVVGRYEVVKF
jgi:hypothetical protein